MPRQWPLLVSLVLLGGVVAAQRAPLTDAAPRPLDAPAQGGAVSAAPKVWTTADDHQDMMAQLGIARLRPGPSGREGAPNPANYDEATANPYPTLPEVLRLESGVPVTSAEMWRSQRRPEIVELFEREVVGRVPRVVPVVIWTVAATSRGTLGPHAVIGKQLVGHVEHPTLPELNVDIQMTLVTPADSTRPVPVMMMFGGGVLPESLGGPALGRRGGGPPAAGGDPPATEQLIAAGWGFASISPTSIQADNGAGLTRGIIGLVNNGQARSPEDWGSLRAWAWGASRGLDYLETDRAVDATRVGIEGVSRYGKAALVTMAFDTRFAVVLVGSSGEGGAKLHRRNFGEQVENLTGAGEYHWMAGNFLKYGTAESRFGSMNAGDIPVDAHQLIALCAPRPVFISYGVPERGDAHWLDHQGSYMAAVAAGPVFRLLGARDLGTSDDYTREKMPVVNVGLLDGELAWRQHDGGHTDGPNWKYFIPWASARLDRVGAPRTDENSLTAHRQLLDKARLGGIDLYFVGDSITRRWGATDYPDLLTHWTRTFFGWHAANFGWGGDTTANILWRLEHGELDGVHPKAVVVLAGTNDVGAAGAVGRATLVDDVTSGVAAVLRVVRTKAPGARIVLMGILPRSEPALGPTITAINENLSRLADGDVIRYLDLTDRLADRQGRLAARVTADGLHLTLAGYEVWADALEPVLTELLGPRAADDHAPPPTGNPAAAAATRGSVR